ncbi:hypothetical protein GQ55_1G272100 [Panicum hallii var. hallii]|uniref:Uncharacterized protein n=2 Tax=Panicum hallii var. hallii TaxID=1504633 RepID=A0A2T7F809_9POAL|nr:hypothetical protein GQ55_1G272100 [Panicum hallii var. hallii]
MEVKARPVSFSPHLLQIPGRPAQFFYGFELLPVNPVRHPRAIATPIKPVGFIATASPARPARQVPARSPASSRAAPARDQPTMQPSSRARSRSWGAGPWGTTPPLSPRQQAKPRHERSRSTTSTYSPLLPSEQSHGDSGGMAEQAPAPARLEEEEEELSSRPATETEGKASGSADAGMDRVVRRLEREAAAAKQTEMKMLESLVQQTKELEQAKIALEEARLEVAALRQHQQQEAGPAQQQQWSVMDLMFGGVDEEINGLRARLRAASQAEERSRKAADDLTAALSAVTMEAKQVKAWLSDAQAELEAANAEVDRLRGLLQGAEAELWSATEQVDTLTSGWKEAAAGWRAREKALLARARAAEEEAAAARRENADLAGTRRALGDENDALRRALERASEDANAATEALELVSGENADVRDAAAEKERDLEALRRENESLRASEAAAQERAKDLEAQLLAAAAKAPATDDGAAVGKAAEIPLVEKWRREAAQGKLGAAAFLDPGRVLPGRKDRMFASLSNLAELKSAAAAAAMDDYDYEFDHLDVGQYGGGGTEHAMKHKKRRSILRKFGDLFRRRSLYKPDLAPELHNHY